MASELIRIHSVEGFDRSIEELIVKSNIAAREFVEVGGAIIASNAKRQFRAKPGGQKTSKRTGRVYYSYKPPFQAVPPKPTSRSGALAASINVRRVVESPDGWMSETGTSDAVQYAIYVEYGTSKMQKEPYIGKSLKTSESALEALADRVWSEV